MSKPKPDSENFDQLRRSLDDELAQIDPRISRKLVQARLAAVDRIKNKTSWIPNLAPALAFACAMFIIIGVLQLQGPGSKETALDETIFATLTQTSIEKEAADIELIEELEFFEWLDASGSAG